MEDTHIINLFLERSEDAIRQVEVKYEKFCFKIAWNILYNTEDSEECVNDTWLITWNKIPPKTPTKLSAFLGKITRNLALDNFRKKNASKRADTHMMCRPSFSNALSISLKRLKPSARSEKSG